MLDKDGNLIVEESGKTADPATQIDVTKLVTDLAAANAALDVKDKEYKGLQTTYNALHGDNKVLLDEKATWVADAATLKNQIDQASNEQGTFKGQFDDLSARYTELEAKNTVLENKSARTDLILKDFPELLGFETEGLLPVFDGDVEAFTTKLTTFKETVGKQSQKAIDDELDGAGPDGTADENAAPSRDSIIDEMFKIAGNAEKSDRYDELQKALDELDVKSKKSGI